MALSSTVSKNSKTHGAPLHVALLLGAFLLSACGKKEAPVIAPPPPTVAPKAAASSNAQLDSQIADALNGRPTPTLTDSQIESEALDIMARYPSKNAVELLSVPEVNGSLKVALTKLGQDKALQQRISTTVDLAAQFAGFEGGPGATRLDLDLKGYDQPRTARFLQAILSEDPKNIANFLVGEIGEATPELSYGGKDRAANGVSLKPQTPPPAAAAPSPQPD